MKIYAASQHTFELPSRPKLFSFSIFIVIIFTYVWCKDFYGFPDAFTRKLFLDQRSHWSPAYIYTHIISLCLICEHCFCCCYCCFYISHSICSVQYSSVYFLFDSRVRFLYSSFIFLIVAFIFSVLFFGGQK